MKILLAGDSWGIGTYGLINDVYTVTGTGIQGILESQGYTVLNVSLAGDSNKNIVGRIHTDTNHIVFLQTDAFRDNSYYRNDLKFLNPTFLKYLCYFDSVDSYFEYYYNSLYKRLNAIGKKIICVGGWSKLHPSIYNYPNLIPAISSVTELILPQAKDVYLSDFEWFSQLNDHKDVMSKFATEVKQLTIESTAKFDLINQEWNDVHPTQAGYELLVKNIQKYLL